MTGIGRAVGSEPRHVVISVSLPGFPPLPNVKRHWAVQAEDNRQWRWDTYLVATQALREHEHPEDFPLVKAVLELVVIRPDAHWPDDDNAIAAIKPCLDGMSDAKVWTDDRVVRGGVSVIHETGPKGLRLDVTMGFAA